MKDQGCAHALLSLPGRLRDSCFKQARRHTQAASHKSKWGVCPLPAIGIDKTRWGIKGQRDLPLITAYIRFFPLPILGMFWLRAGGLRGQSSSPGRAKNFLFSTSSRPALGPTQLPIQWVRGLLPQGKAAGA
jgi:hypothetical protein